MNTCVLLASLAFAGEARRTQKTAKAFEREISEDASFDPLRTLSMALIASHPEAGFSPVAPMYRSLVRPTKESKNGQVSMQASETFSPWRLASISPDGSLVQRVEGKTRKTWKFNDVSKDRVQVALESEGRPVHADIKLWIGPDWTPFNVKAYTEDGKLRPIQTLVGTRNKLAMIEALNTGEYEFPMQAACNYAQGELAALSKELPAEFEGERVDGQALTSLAIDNAAERIEVVLKTDGRQLNARIEILNAPNNPKQTFECFTNNGELNSLVVAFNTPDAGNTVRVVNLAPVEFPCYVHVKSIA